MIGTGSGTVSLALPRDGYVADQRVMAFPDRVPPPPPGTASKWLNRLGAFLIALV